MNILTYLQLLNESDISLLVNNGCRDEHRLSFFRGAVTEFYVFVVPIILS